MGAPHDVTPLTVYNAFCGGGGGGRGVMYLWTVTASQGGAGVSTGVDGCPGGVRTEGDELEGGDGGARVLPVRKQSCRRTTSDLSLHSFVIFIPFKLN